MATLTVAKKTPEEQVACWKQHLTLKYNKEGSFVLTQDRYHTLLLFYSTQSGLMTPGIQSMLLDALKAVVKSSICDNIPVSELCTVVAESRNVQLAWSILSPCGPTVEIGLCWECWCSMVCEWVLQAGGGGWNQDWYMLYGGVANFISQLGDISIQGGVAAYTRDWWWVAASNFYIHTCTRTVYVCILNLKQVLIICMMMMVALFRQTQ